jgi:Domain of unknown function (DUF4397)
MNPAGGSLGPMRNGAVVAARCVVAAGGLLVACTSNGASRPVGDDAGPGLDSGAPLDSGNSSGDDGAADSGDAAVAQAYVRVAHWSPDAPGLDACFNRPGAPWTGQVPQLAAIAAAADAGSFDDGGAGGIAFPQVSAYLVIPPGTYAVRLVAAGSADCATTVVDLASVVLGPGTFTTVAALGEVKPVATDQALMLTAFPDDVSAPPGQIALRFLNASPSQGLSPADFGTGSLAGTGGLFAALFAGVAFGQTGASSGSDAGAVDASGYVALNPFATATVSAHPSQAATDATVALNDVTIAGGSAATVALVDGVSNPMASSTVKLLQCADVDDSTGTSLLSTCSIVSTP